MAVVLVVVFRWFPAVGEPQVVASEYGQDVPAKLEQCVALARTQRAESHHGVPQLLAVLVEGGVNEAVMFECLFKDKK